MSEGTPKPAARDVSADYRLTTSFPYLVRRIGIRIGELFDRAIAPYDVDVSMYRVMAALAEEDGQQLGRLGCVTSIELSTLSRLVGAMVAKGLLTRRRPHDNGRIVEISLAARGRKLANELMPIAAHFERSAVGDLGASDVARLKLQLRAAYDNLDQLERALEAAPPAPSRATSPSAAVSATAGRPPRRRAASPATITSS